jgi:hypothetical protein
MDHALPTLHPDPLVAARIATQRAEDLSRLADQAARAGVAILVDHRREQHIAVDPATRGAAYLVDAAGCTCRRFRLLGRCGHHALLLSELGRIPDPDPVASFAVTVVTLAGEGVSA